MTNIFFKTKTKLLICLLFVVVGVSIMPAGTSLTSTANALIGPVVPGSDEEFQPKTVTSSHTCGGDPKGADKMTVNTSLDLGCTGKNSNPIYDFLFAALRFLSVGVGVVLVISTILAGIQYTWAKGDPNSVSKAKNRLLYVFIAMMFYILSFALINFLVPGGLLKAS